MLCLGPVTRISEVDLTRPRPWMLHCRGWGSSPGLTELLRTSWIRPWHYSNETRDLKVLSLVTCESLPFGHEIILGSFLQTVSFFDNFILISQWQDNASFIKTRSNCHQSNQFFSFDWPIRTEHFNLNRLTCSVNAVLLIFVGLGEHCQHPS